MVIISNPGEEVITVESEQMLLRAQISNLAITGQLVLVASVKLWAT